MSLHSAITDGLCVCLCVFVHFQKTMHSPPLSLSVRQQYTCGRREGAPPLCFNVTVKTSRLHTRKHSSGELGVWKNEGKEREGQRGQEGQREREREASSLRTSLIQLDLTVSLYQGNILEIWLLCFHFLSYSGCFLVRLFLPLSACPHETSGCVDSSGKRWQ